MTKKIVNEYEPDYVSAPGETLEETLEALKMSQTMLAERTGYSSEIINEIIQGTGNITPEIALAFEEVLGIPAHFWLKREKRYQEFLTRAQSDMAEQPSLLTTQKSKSK